MGVYYYCPIWSIGECTIGILLYLNFALLDIEIFCEFAIPDAPFVWNHLEDFFFKVYIIAVLFSEFYQLALGKFVGRCFYQADSANHQSCKCSC